MSRSSLYINRDSTLHRLDPRSTLAGIIGLFIAGYIFDHPAFAGVPMLVGFTILVLVGGWPNLRRLTPIIVALFSVGLAVWPFFTPAGGSTLIAFGPVALTEREIFFALGRSERIATFIFGGLIFVTTTTNEEIVRGLRQLGFPYVFCFAIGTALRLFPTFIDAAQTVRQAQEARGLDIQSGGLRDRLRNYIPLLIPVFMTAFRNVTTQSMALEARGFDTQRQRTFYNKTSLKRVDWAVILVAFVVAVTAVWLRTQGFGTL
ncbi:MAG: ABC-type cobalt transport system, permease component CbiQ related transporter [Haloquadratum sp. J07HQX50]|jgi:ABC-type cobalt transport system, permease component CbiQ and related transporters|nr:MAG: ABC-type cobalt transport system, permease component CbiQ related transporter [Haloquadratum sp. J07HQX50]